MKLINEWEISRWAINECRKGNDIPEIRKLITSSVWAYHYCRFFDNDPEVRKHVTNNWYLECLNELDLKKEKSIIDSIRKPIPKSSRPLTTKKGKKGYNRKEERKKEKELNDIYN